MKEKIDFYIFNELSEIQREEFISLTEEYLPGSDPQKILSRYKDYGEAYIAAVDCGKVIGVCFGWPRMLDAPEDQSFTLDGIAVNFEYSRKGIGKEMLCRFEAKVKALGFATVSVGSAGGYVEDFYLAAGYFPLEYKIWNNEKCVAVKQFINYEDYKFYKRPADKDGFVVMEKKLL